MQVGTCACVTNFFSFSFFASHDSLSLSEITCANRLCMCETIFSFLFLFLLDMILVMIFFFGSPIPQKRTDFLDSMWEVPSWYIDSS